MTEKKKTRKEKSIENKARWAEMRKKAKQEQVKNISASIVTAKRYSEEFFNQILDEIRAGKTFAQVKKELKLDSNALWNKKKNDLDFAKRYQEAVLESCDIEFDAIDESLKEEPRVIFDAQGNKVYDRSDIEWKRVRIDAKKWILSRKNPAKYGDRVAVAGDKDNPLMPAINLVLNT